MKSKHEVIEFLLEAVKKAEKKFKVKIKFNYEIK